jgi:hypothetical protein
MKTIGSLFIEKWDSTALDDYADLVCYGAQLLAELKPQVVIKEYVPGLTRADDSGGAPFLRATYSGLLLSLENVKIPPLSYSLVNFFDKVIEWYGAEPEAGSLAAYIYPFRPSKTYAEVETLLNTITSLYKASLFAGLTRHALVPISMSWLNQINEVSILSQWGLSLATYIPSIYDNGGAETTTEEEFDGDAILWGSQSLKIPEYADAYPFFRFSAQTPYFYSPQSPANDKINIKTTASPEDTTWTALGKASSTYDWVYSVATGRSVTQRGMYGQTTGCMNMAKKESVLPSAEAWDRRVTNWIVKHMFNTGIPEVSAPVIGDMIQTQRRGTPPAPGSPAVALSTNPVDRGIQQRDAQSQRGIHQRAGYMNNQNSKAITMRRRQR